MGLLIKLTKRVDIPGHYIIVEGVTFLHSESSVPAVGLGIGKIDLFVSDIEVSACDYGFPLF